MSWSRSVNRMGIAAEDRLKRGRRTDSMPSFYHEAHDRGRLPRLALWRPFTRLCDDFRQVRAQAGGQVLKDNKKLRGSANNEGKVPGKFLQANTARLPIIYENLA